MKPPLTASCASPRRSPHEWQRARLHPRDEWLAKEQPPLQEYDRRRSEQVAQLTSMRTMVAGWDSYDAEPPIDIAIDNALRVLRVIWTCDDPPQVEMVVPSVEGGVGIVFSRRGERYSDIECFNSGEILAVTSTRGALPEVWSVSFGDIKRSLAKISSFLDG